MSAAFPAASRRRKSENFSPQRIVARQDREHPRVWAALAIAGDRYADALAASKAWLRQSGVMPVHAFDQHETMLGQGTLAVEFEQQASAIDMLLVAVGGGGLIAGIAAWYRGRVKVVGVEPVAAPTLTKALEAGRPVDAEAGGVAANSLAPRRVGERGFPIIEAHVAAVALVTNDAIVQAQKALWAAARIVAQGAACGPTVRRMALHVLRKFRNHRHEANTTCVAMVKPRHSARGARLRSIA